MPTTTTTFWLFWLFWPPDTFNCTTNLHVYNEEKQQSRAIAMKPCDAAGVLFGLKFAGNIHCKFKSIAKLRKPGFRASNMLAQNRVWRKMAIQGHVFWSQWKGDKGLSNRLYEILMLALFVTVPTMYSIYTKDPQSFRGYQVLCGSRCASVHLHLSRDHINRLYSKCVK